MGKLDTRVGQVESAFTERMQEQVNLLTAITNTQSQHTTDLIALQRQEKVNTESITSIQQRLDKLESNPPKQPHTNSTTAVEDRQPALMMGGQLAKDTVAKMQLDIDMEGVFVPGVRRGYLVIPYATHNNQTEGNMFGRLTAAIQKVRSARKATGALNPDGSPKHLWLGGWHILKRQSAEGEQDTLAKSSG